MQAREDMSELGRTTRRTSWTSPARFTRTGPSSRRSSPAPLTGNVTGNCTGSAGSCTGNAATATTAAACSGNAATSSSCSGNAATASKLLGGTSFQSSSWFNSDEGSKRLLFISAGTSYYESPNNTHMFRGASDGDYTGNIGCGTIYAAGTITGNLTGTVTGNCTGSSGSCTGNAATATTATGLTGTPNLAVGTVASSTAWIGGNVVVNKQLVLYDGGFADAVATATNFYGFGVNGSTLRYQVPSGQNHIWYAGSTSVMSIAGGVVSGTFSGNVTGNCTGSSGSCTGNAATATVASGLTGTPNISVGTVTTSGQATVAGYLGVSTTSPSYPLHVNAVSGTVSIYATGDITAFSDARVKTNLVPIDDALDKVMAVTGYTYERTDLDPATGNRQAGVIAQEVEAVLPEVVHTDAVTGMKSVAYGNMVALLIQAVKEMKCELDDNKAELDSVKIELAILQGR